MQRLCARDMMTITMATLDGDDDDDGGDDDDADGDDEDAAAADDDDGDNLPHGDEW